MTGDEFGEVDIDLLADYVGGALDGAPEHATVAALIVRDPAWRAAYDALVAGVAAVGSGLAALGATAEPMPADLAARIDAALAAPVAGGRDHEIPAETGPGREAATGRRGKPATGRRREAATGPSGQAATGPSGEAANRPSGGAATGPSGGAATTGRRRRMRWAVPVAVAAALLAFAGFWTDYLTGGTSTTSHGASTAAGRAEGTPLAATDGAPGAQAGPPAAALPPADRIQSSGTDYQPGSLASRAMSATKEPATTKQIAPTPGLGTDSAAGSLARLRPAAGLLACLQAIAGGNGAGPITVQLVDYARYAGSPAIVVRFTAANGTWVWASGPDCGAPGAGASRLDAAKVG